MKKGTKDINIEWAILCQSASVDQQNNTVSLFNIIEQINLNATDANPPSNLSDKDLIDLPEQAFVPIKPTLVIQTERNDTLAAPVQFRVEIIDPSGDVLGSNDFQLEAVLSNNKKTRAIVNMDGFPVKRSGRYSISISTKSKSETDFTKQYDAHIDVNILAPKE